METKDFLCACLGVCSWKVDEITDNFDVDIIDSDVYALLNSGIDYKRFGNVLIWDMYKQVINRSVEELGLDEHKFDYYADGGCSSLYYDGEKVNAWKDLEGIAEKLNS